MMPGKDGFTVARELKADKETSSIPIIMVTALSSTQDKVKGLEAGAEEFLSKPVNREEIRTRIASVLKLKQYQTQLNIRKQTESSLRIEKIHTKKELRQKEQPKVLIVDDDSNDQKLILNYLKDENFDILTANNGKEGLKTALQEKVDLIILDVLLPKMDGFMVCRRIKQSQETRDIQVVLITCLDDMESRIKGVEIGADDFLVKPLESRELVARSRTLIKKKGYIDQLHEHCERAISSAIMDGLTGLYNNAYFKQFLELEIKRCLREKHPLSLLMMDIDEFKTINDTVGHYKGDEVLRKVADIIQSSIREIDLAARYGGDEFAIVFPYTQIDGALLAAERIQRNLGSNKIIVEGIEKPLSINTSIGLSTYPGSAISLVEMINVADAMLYRAKKNGKNRIEIHRPEREGGFLKIVAAS
jgi:two-component system cell cycle response regulator